MLDHHKIILAIAGFIYDRDKRVLIVEKSKEKKVDGGLWTVPGGKVERDEPIISALAREIKEEVGLTLATEHWIGEDVFENSGDTYHAQHFLCTVKATEPIILESGLLNYRWVRKSDLNNFPFHPNIKKRLEIIFETLL